MGLTVGTKLGPYEIVVLLGEGGMGEVYRATDTRLDRPVVIKIIRSHLSSEPGSRERFEREARAISALNHPNICHLYDVGTWDGKSYLVLECLEGETLADRVRKGALPFAQTLRYGTELADALDTAHRRGIVHRDLKPANIFLTSHGECKILDFGLAKLEEETFPEMSTVVASTALTSPGSTVGTLAYMSPEQARGEPLDARTDLFSFGAVLYEVATGKMAFRGKTSAMICKAILDETPSPISQANPELPQRLDEIVSKALEKDRGLRYQSAAEIRSDLQRLKRDSESGKSVPRVAAAAPRPRRLWKIVTVVAAVVMTAALAAVILFRSGGPTKPESMKWEQLTFFTDSAVYPALSPDGRMLAFIRGNDSFLGPGQIYVKLLPSGDPAQLTHDSTSKLGPAFSPDGSRIAYGTVDPWDVWEVPILGGQPHRLLANASSLTWINDGKRLLFSEIKQGLHMALVSTDSARGQSRDVYVPPGDRSMVHHSYLSPDGRWVLVVMMNNQGQLIPCRIVPFEGSSEPRIVGPPDGTCISGAWSLDGKWVYLSANSGGKFHVWRQKFPDGQPEQVTSGPTEEEGVAMAPDGKSLLTSVGVSDSTQWVHDANGDRQISSEGNAGGSSFSRDGSKLYYLMQSGQSPGLELWVTELASGRSERVLPGYSMLPSFFGGGYAISQDERRVAFAMKDQHGTSHLWVAPLNRRSSPQQLPSPASEDSPFFLPDGDLAFRATEGGLNFLYRMHPDGSARRKIIPDAILDLTAISPDGRWVVTEAKSQDEEHTTAIMAYSLDGAPAVRLCNSLCLGGWDAQGKFFGLQFPNAGDANTYVMPVSPARGLPNLPPNGVTDGKDLKADTKILVIPHRIESAVSPTLYSFTRETIRRNIYRIPLP
jgi:Tol biopolymer transport system component/tRNA A-37 threonylcarbamoyl transferase component Bud32